MQPLRLLAISTIFVLLTACGSDGGSTSDPTDTSDTDTHVADADLDATSNLDVGIDTSSDALGDTTITVSGRVVAGRKGPIPGIQVGLLPDRVAVTDDDGAFEFSEVQTPYDLVAINAGPRPIAVLYRGLTRPDPSIYHPQSIPRQTADVSGTVTGGLFDEASPPTFSTHVTFIPTDPSEPPISLEIGNSAGTTGDFNFDLEWTGSQTRTGRLVSLQFEVDARGHPSTYTGFGQSTEFSISAGDSLTDIDVPLDQPVEDRAVSLDVSEPAGWRPPFVEIYQTFQGTGSLRTMVLSDPMPDAIILPAAEHLASHAYGGTSKDGTFASGVSFRTDLDIDSMDTYRATYLAPGRLLDPQNNAGSIDLGERFHWEAQSDAISVVLLTAPSTPSAGPNPSLFIVTDETSFELPDLSAYRFSLTSDAEYRWTTLSFAPIDHIDDASSAKFLSGAPIFVDGTLTSDLFEHPLETRISESRTFRTAP